MDKRIKKMWHTHTLEYNSWLTKYKNLSYATTWMKLEDIMLNETNQQQKDKYCMIMLIWVAQMAKNAVTYYAGNLGSISG